jgi:hypothetical protein
MLPGLSQMQRYLHPCSCNACPCVRLVLVPCGSAYKHINTEANEAFLTHDCKRKRPMVRLLCADTTSVILASMGLRLWHSPRACHHLSCPYLKTSGSKPRIVKNTKCTKHTICRFPCKEVRVSAKLTRLIIATAANTDSQHAVIRPCPERYSGTGP